MNYNYYNPSVNGYNYNGYANDRYNQQYNQSQMQQYAQAQQFQQIQQPTQQTQGLNITPVSSIDEVKAKSVDWSGRAEYFIDNANNKVYSKFLDVNGIPRINVYSLDSNNDINVEYATKEEVNKLKSIIDNFLEGLGGVKNEQ